MTMDLAFVGNLLWFVLGGGIFACLGWALLGVLMFITIICIPFGFAAFRIAGFAAFPFGKDLVPAELIGEERIVGTTLANILWVILAGLWLALGHALAGVTYCISIVGIPFGLAHFKLARISFAPLGKRTVSAEVAKTIWRRQAEEALKP